MRKLVLVLLVISATASLHAQRKGAAKSKLPAAAKPAVLAPLTPRERAQQLLNRFTFGARPGDVEQVLAVTPEKWFEQQLNPGSIPDDALNRRLNEYQTLNMQPDQALLLFPDRFTLQQVAEGHRPYPADPLLAAM